jgi:hypothetical protein
MFLGSLYGSIDKESPIEDCNLGKVLKSEESSTQSIREIMYLKKSSKPNLVSFGKSAVKAKEWVLKPNTILLPFMLTD